MEICSPLEGQESINNVFELFGEFVTFIGGWSAPSYWGLFVNSAAADSLVLWVLLYNPFILG